MKRVLMAALLILATASCGEKPAPPRPAPPTQALPPQPQTPAPRPPRTSRPSVPSEAADQCGAKALQHLVGKPRSAIPVPVDVSKRRVTCTTCPVTMDYRADRLNIFFDAQTGIIKEVKCG